LTELWSNWWK